MVWRMALPLQRLARSQIPCLISSESQFARALAGSGKPKAAAVDHAIMTEAGVPTASNMIDFLCLMQNLKTSPRRGWVLRDVQNAESIADHMYRMAVMALVMSGSREYDHQKLVKMAIVHDMAEAIVGDITPADNVPKADKHAREAAALLKIEHMLGSNTAAAKEISALWWEYEASESMEAKLCKDFDKLEMILQAMEYEIAQGAELQEFFDSTRDKWQTDLGRRLAAEVVSRRQAQAVA